MRQYKFRAWVPELVAMGKPFIVFDSQFLASGGTFPEGTIFMQYTGLKDRLGKEIYEGDILETVQGTRFIVKWHQEECRWAIETSTGKYTLQEYMVPNIWIEGNIYEHPKLIEA